jgi:hypothetical protein
MPAAGDVLRRLNSRRMRNELHRIRDALRAQAVVHARQRTVTNRYHPYASSRSPALSIALNWVCLIALNGGTYA